jgi:hypothetical protein
VAAEDGESGRDEGEPMRGATALRGHGRCSYTMRAGISIERAEHMSVIRSRVMRRFA